ncbi:hypothetical protein ASF77_20620 [Massilia sp. Leaf139]|nr:hypothetical protein ASF77_20620 [Massilia sp. Leaf139]
MFGDYSSRTSDSPQGSLFVIGRNLRTEQLVAANRNPFDLALLGNTGVVMKLVRSRWGRDLRSGIVGLGMVPVPASVPASVPA